MKDFDSLRPSIRVTLLPSLVSPREEEGRRSATPTTGATLLDRFGRPLWNLWYRIKRRVGEGRGLSVRGLLRQSGVLWEREIESSGSHPDALPWTQLYNIKSLV